MVLNDDGHCKSCKALSRNHYVNQRVLPTWKDEKDILRFDVPPELSGLTIGEQMLIQMAAPFVPLRHIWRDHIGIKGHVCSFPQRVDEIVTELPRLPKDVNVLRMVRTFKKGPNGEVTTKTFRINKCKVLQALRWLVKFNVEYKKHVTIKEDNLSWMGDEREKELADVRDIINDVHQDDLDDEVVHEDTGPASQQCMDQHVDYGEHVPSVGRVSEEHCKEMNNDQRENMKSLSGSAQKGGIATLNWPTVDDEPMSEYSDVKILVRAFPWLFPGGVGDFVERLRSKKIKPDDWANILLNCKDGRFQRDPVFCFFVLNCIQRRKNQDQGKVCVKGHMNGAPKSLHQLQQQLENGDDRFVKQTTYFTQRVRGSNSYWRGKRFEVHSWINHHLETGNGLPNLFITLSCAEFWWPDLRRLLTERVKLAEGRDVDLDNNETERCRVAHDYAAVVQECFQLRLGAWLKTVGKEVFRIKHCWVRFEFAKGRGQIHAHMLAVSDTKMMHNEELIDAMKKSYEHRDDPIKRAKHVNQWASLHFDIKAEHPGTPKDHDGATDLRNVGPPEGSAKKAATNPCSVRFGDTAKDGSIGSKERYHQDVVDLCNCCQMHQCNGCCLTKCKNQKTNKTARQVIALTSTILMSGAFQVHVRGSFRLFLFVDMCLFLISCRLTLKHLNNCCCFYWVRTYVQPNSTMTVFLFLLNQQHWSERE